MKVFAALIPIQIIVLFVSTLCHAATPINLRVVWTESPQTKAVVAWDSKGAGEGTLHVRETDGSKGTKAMKAGAAEYPKPKNDEITHCFTVPLSDLKPSTKYFLTAQIGESKGSEHYFITAPDKDVDFKVFFAGDSRTRLDKTRAGSMAMKEAFEKDPSYLCLLHGGDFANSPKTKYWHPWLAAYSLTTTKDKRILPIIPVRGNHEGKGAMFDIAYGTPGKKDQNYFVCSLSPGVSIVVLNTNISAEGDQKTFLEKALNDLKEKKVRFQMTAYHRPLYPAIKGPARGRKAWVPLFEKYNIDLGLESDGHCIKRTVPIRGEKMVEDGVVYLGEGGYGAPQRGSKGGRWYLDKPGFISKGDHFMVLSFTRETIDYWTQDLDKGNVDSATFPARKR